MEQSTTPQGYWRKCTTCKKTIGFNQKYWICSVSTCNRVRTDLVFCDLRCFDAHVPVMNHRDAGAFERAAPSEKAFLAQQFEEQKVPNSPERQPQRQGDAPQKKMILPQQTPSPSAQLNAVSDEDILVVVSKVKAYIKARSGMNTSDAVMEVLSQEVRHLCDDAIKNAVIDGRKTVMDRDF